MPTRATAGASEVHLYFGCRHAAQDWIFKDEMLEMLQREGQGGGSAGATAAPVLTKLVTAFSRDQTKTSIC